MNNKPLNNAKMKKYTYEWKDCKTEKETFAIIVRAY